MREKYSIITSPIMTLLAVLLVQPTELSIDKALKKWHEAIAALALSWPKL
jgi:hypothetical protein